MAKSRHRKDHKKKLAARKNKIEQAKKTFQKRQREFIMEMIKKEQEAGAFKDNQGVPGADGPTLGFDGPSLGFSSESPLSENPSIDNKDSVEKLPE